MYGDKESFDSTTSNELEQLIISRSLMLQIVIDTNKIISMFMDKLEHRYSAQRVERLKQYLKPDGNLKDFCYYHRLEVLRDTKMLTRELRKHLGRDISECH